MQNNTIYIYEKTFAEALAITFTNAKIYKSQFNKLCKEVQYLCANIYMLNNDMDISNWIICTYKKPDLYLLEVKLEFTYVLNMIKHLRRKNLKKIANLKSLTNTLNNLQKLLYAIDEACIKGHTNFLKSTKRKYLNRLKLYNKRINNLQLDVAFQNASIVSYYLFIKQNCLIWCIGQTLETEQANKDIKELKNICDTQILLDYIGTSITLSN